MAIGVYFNNKKVVIPGAYSTITSGESNSPRALDYGTVMIIDNLAEGTYSATNPDFSGGSGIDGTNAKGKDAIYQFSNIDDFRNFIKGGKWWKYAEALFKPDSSNAAAIGVSNILYVRNAKTTPSTITINNDGDDDSLQISTIDEGYWTVGQVTATGSVLYQGYAYDIVPGIIDDAKFIVRFWRGSYKGAAADGLAWDEISKENTVPTLVCQSKEVADTDGLISWMKSSSTFNSYFSIEKEPTANFDLDVTGQHVSVDAGGNVVNVNIVPGSDQLASGGETTKVANSGGLQMILEAIKTTRNSFVITDIQNTGSSFNQTLSKVLNHINSDATFKKILFIAGEDGEDGQAGLANTCKLAEAINDCHAAVVFGGVAMPTNSLAVGYRWFNAEYNMCLILGRLAGKEPQVPVTNKTIGISKLRYQLSDKDKEQALGAGVLCTIYNEYLERYVVLQGINTLQDNEQLFNNKGESFSLQFMRIVDQINKELVVNAEIDLLADENGVNANTLSSGILKNWTESYLQSRTASEGADNLLLSFRNVTVNRQDDYYLVTYGIVVNNEVNKIFFTGFVFRS